MTPADRPHLDTRSAAELAAAGDLTPRNPTMATIEFRVRKYRIDSLAEAVIAAIRQLYPNEPDLGLTELRGVAGARGLIARRLH